MLEGGPFKLSSLHGPAAGSRSPAAPGQCCR